MRITKPLNTIVALLVCVMSFAQDFQGEATYKSHRKIDIQLDSTQVNSEMHQQMMAMMKKQFEKTFILTFNKEESLYEEDKELEAPQAAGFQMIMVDTGGSDILYKNIQEESFTSQNEIWGKIFLVEDSLETPEWTLTNETKNIGNYTCYKATTTREQQVVRGGISINGDKDLEADDEQEADMETIIITAWYAPDIPVNNGPARYQGLPGLILEVNDGNETLMCSKIVLNPKDQKTIKAPSKGKKVSQSEFEAIVEKKMKEMRERYDSERHKGDGVEIRIRG